MTRTGSLYPDDEISGGTVRSAVVASASTRAPTHTPASTATPVSPSVSARPAPSPVPPPATTSPSLGEAATVAKVVDGDTIRVNLLGTEERVRIIGLDSPESLRPNTPVKYALEATAAAESMLSPGDRVYLLADPTQDQRDRFDRLLAHVVLEDTSIFAERMIEDGWDGPLHLRGAVHLRRSIRGCPRERSSGRTRPVGSGHVRWRSSRSDGSTVTIRVHQGDPLLKPFDRGSRRCRP